MISGSAVFHVVSDLHLAETTPGIANLFLDFLADLRRDAAEQPDKTVLPTLYLLGDIFEYWAGDDDLSSPFNASICQALRETTQVGIEIGFIAGNRDFLIGPGFAAATGVRLLPDPFILSLPSWQFALTHGDSFCTDDLTYQQFRAMVRQPEWQQRFLAQALTERKRQIEAIRQQSEANRQSQSTARADLTDVNKNTVEDFLHQQGYPTLIHGHTHRPMTHHHIVVGIHCERWVLADWHESSGRSGRPAGEVISWDGQKLQRESLPHSGLRN